MKKENVVAVAVIGMMLLGMFIAAMGNMLGLAAFMIGGSVLTVRGVI